MESYYSIYYAKQRQLVAVIKALPSKVESMLSTLNITGKKKYWYQVVAKKIGILPLSIHYKNWKEQGLILDCGQVNTVFSMDAGYREYGGYSFSLKIN